MQIEEQYTFHPSHYMSLGMSFFENMCSLSSNNSCMHVYL